MPDRDSTRNHKLVVLFDGECNLCNWAVQFIINRDPADRFRFAALQSDAGRRLLASAISKDATLPGAPAPGDTSKSAALPDTLILIENGTGYVRSGAALRIARHLRRPWSFFHLFILLPAPWRDFVYKWVARNRYRWFGKRSSCMVPTPELRSRFLA